MGQSKGSPGINRLGRVLQNHIKRVSDGPLILDFGTIQADYSLLTNTYPIPIPKNDYLVCRDLTHNPAEPLTVTSEATVSGETHTHNVTLPDSMKWLTAGDRVLVAWVQNDAVVIDIIIPASEIGG